MSDAACPEVRDTTPTPPAFTVGIDVSRHQGFINWERVAKATVADASGDKLASAGPIDFAIFKLTDGIRYRHTHYGLDGLRMARDAGIPRRGAYHWLLPYYSGGEQARFFLDTLGDTPVDLIALDVEDVNLTVYAGQQVVDFAAVIRNVTGKAPAIYVNPTDARRLELWRHPELGGECLLWVADWTPPADVPRPWIDWTLWQYSAKGRVDGIRGDVDLNRARLVL